MKRKWWLAGILVLLELLVCAGILLAFWWSRDSAEDALAGVRFFYIADTHVEETVEETFAVDGPAVLDLNGAVGDVRVMGSAADEVQLTARLSLWGEDEQDARRQVRVETAQEGNRITVRVERLRLAYVGVVRTGSSRVDFEIQVPYETALRLVTSSGDLTVSGITGTVELETDFGDIRAEQVRGAVSARSSSGGVTLVDLTHTGDLVVATDFGDLLLREVVADNLTAQSGSGQIRAEGGRIGGALDLKTDFGDVTAVGVDAASYRLTSGSGNLTLDGCGGPLDLQTDFGDIEVRNAADAQLVLDSNSGSILFSGSLRAHGEHRLESDFGDVRVALPADAAFDLDAETEFGSIDTDFAVTVSEFEERHIVGEVNGGDALLWIKTGSGGISVEELPSASD
jgi:DUF4097 and DUF4098 domain-containing protein YvlB